MRDGRNLAHLYLAVDPSSENPQQRQAGHQSAVPPVLAEEMLVIQDELGEHRFSSGRFDDAARLMEQITTSDDLIDFLTLPGYRLLA
jgi:malate synthase